MEQPFFLLVTCRQWISKIDEQEGPARVMHHLGGSTTTTNNKQQTTNTTNNYKNLRMNIQLTDCVWQGAFLSLDIHELSAGEFAVKMRIS
jgi:hypothetical protein